MSRMSLSTLRNRITPKTAISPNAISTFPAITTIMMAMSTGQHGQGGRQRSASRKSPHAVHI